MDLLKKDFFLFFSEVSGRRTEGGGGGQEKGEKVFPFNKVMPQLRIDLWLRSVLALYLRKVIYNECYEDKQGLV